jgi:hypothetical protein
VRALHSHSYPACAYTYHLAAMRARGQARARVRMYLSDVGLFVSSCGLASGLGRRAAVRASVLRESVRPCVCKCRRGVGVPVCTCVCAHAHARVCMRARVSVCVVPPRHTFIFALIVTQSNACCLHNLLKEAKVHIFRILNILRSILCPSAIRGVHFVIHQPVNHPPPPPMV